MVLSAVTVSGVIELLSRGKVSPSYIIQVPAKFHDGLSKLLAGVAETKLACVIICALVMPMPPPAEPCTSEVVASQ